MSNIREIINTVYLSDKYHILDSFTAGGLTIALTQFLEGTIKYVGWALTIVLFIRGLYGLYKDRLDVKNQKISTEKQKIELKLKKIELEKQLNQKQNAKVIKMDSAI